MLNNISSRCFTPPRSSSTCASSSRPYMHKCRWVILAAQPKLSLLSLPPNTKDIRSKCNSPKGRCFFERRLDVMYRPLSHPHWLSVTSRAFLGDLGRAQSRHGVKLKKLYILVDYCDISRLLLPPLCFYFALLCFSFCRPTTYPRSTPYASQIRSFASSHSVFLGVWLIILQLTSSLVVPTTQSIAVLLRFLKVGSLYYHPGWHLFCNLTTLQVHLSHSYCVYLH